MGGEVWLKEALLCPSGLGRTLRRDAWWMENIPVIILLGGFGVYATLRAFEGKFFDGALIFHRSILRSLTHQPLVAALARAADSIFPLGFRTTCYYYRKAYYRAFFLDPPGCAVGEPAHRNYRGETQFPFHPAKYSSLFSLWRNRLPWFLWYDAIKAFWFPGSDQKLHFGIGVGTLVLLANIVLLTLYMFSCHSLRHIVGGKIDCFSCTAFNRTRHAAGKNLLPQ